MTRTASRRITSGVGKSGSPSPRLILPGCARSEIFRIMLFSMPRRNGGGWNWLKENDSSCPSISGCESLVDHAPEAHYGFSLFIKEVFKESWFIEYGRIRISFLVLTKFGNPVARLSRVEYREQRSRIKKGSARIVQNTKLICFDTNHHIRLILGQIPISRISLL